MKPRLIIIALSLASCAGFTPAQMGGMSHVNKDSLELQYILTVQQFVRTTKIGITTERADQIWAKVVNVHFVPEAWDCSASYPKRKDDKGNSIRTNCNGQMWWDARGRYFVKLKAANCLPLTSFTHEVLHILVREVLNIKDADKAHSLKDLFNDPFGEFNKDAAQHKAAAAGIFHGLCGEET